MELEVEIRFACSQRRRQGVAQLRLGKRFCPISGVNVTARSPPATFAPRTSLVRLLRSSVVALLNPVASASPIEALR